MRVLGASSRWPLIPAGLLFPFDNRACIVLFISLILAKAPHEEFFGID